MAAAPATNRSALQTSMIKPTNIAAEAISIRAIILLQYVLPRQLLELILWTRVKMRKSGLLQYIADWSKGT
jgi:hypothetical protein